jgi:hypothetical protein
LRVLTSDPSNHVTRRLRSHLNHQETTTSRRGTSYQCSRASPPGCVKPLKSAPYMDNRLCLAGLDIRSIEPCHETSEEPSKPPGDDDITSRYLLPVHTRSRPGGAKSVDFVTKSAPHTSLGLQLAGLDIRSIEPRHETSEEPSRSPGDDDITSRYLLPVLESISPQGV